MKQEFHDHLDRCEQCRNHPMNLCLIGARILHGTQSAPAAAPDAGAPQDRADVFPAIEDVLAKHCRGRAFEPTTRENIAALIDRILTLDAERVQELQRLKLAPAAHQETPEPTCRCGHVLESHLNAAAMQHCRECACRAFEEAAPARAAEWQPLIEAAKDAVREWRLHGQLTDSCRHLEAALDALPPGALAGDSNSKT